MDESLCKIVDDVEDAYRRLQSQLDSANPHCNACGQCCDFDAFGHRLYLTTPELLYFKTRLAENGIPPRPMTGGVCPWRVEGKCSVYAWRFAGCRIFNCTGDADLQSRLSEEILSCMKRICQTQNLPYQYRDLKSALNTQ